MLFPGNCFCNSFQENVDA